MITLVFSAATNDTIAPKIVKFVHNYTAVFGGSVDLCCLAIGEPIPLIVWSRDNRILLPIAGEVKLKHEGILTLYNVTRQDAGIYICTAKNTIGMDYHTALLTVIDIRPSVVTLTTESTVLLSSIPPPFIPSSWDDGTYILVLLVIVYIITFIIVLFLTCIIYLSNRDY